MVVIATRRERVVLDLETNFPQEAAKAAAAVALLNEEIHRLGGRGSTGSPLKTVGRDIEDVGRRADRAAPSIDKFSGRVSLLAQGFAALGPSLIPIGAIGIPAITGLASSFGFAALAGGTMIGAFHGVGDALKAMNDAALEPTEAHLTKAREAMSQISPEARKFVRELRTLQPELARLQATAAAGMIPGMAEGLEQLSGALPKVERIVAAVAGELGDIAASAGKSLGGERWADFFDFLAQEAPQALQDMADGTGNVAHAMAELWMAFQPLNSSFSTWLVDSTADLDKWASGLSKTQGFQEFVGYIQANGPQVAATMGAIANAVLQIVEAAAPIGGPVLTVIEGLANAIASIADSDIGTPLFGMVAALSALNLAMKAGEGIQSRFGSAQGRLSGSFEKQRTSLRSLAADWRTYTAVTNSAQGRAQASATQIIAQAEASERLRKSFRATAVEAGKAGALVGAFAVASTGLGDKLGVNNTIMLAMAGSVIPGYGTAIGAAAGFTLDLAHANDNLKDAATGAATALKSQNLDAMSAALTRVNNELETAAGPSGLEKLVKLLPVAGAGFSQLLGSQRQGDVAKLKGLRDQLDLQSRGLAAGPLGAAGSVLPSDFKSLSVAAAAAAARLKAARDAASETAHSFVGLGGSVDDSKVSLNGWSRQMAQMAASLRQFTANSLIAANRGLRQGLIAELQKAGPEGALRMKQLANGTETQIKRANRAWGSQQAAIRAYKDAIGGVPASKSTKFTSPGAAQAKAQIRAMRDEISRLKDKTVHADEKGSAAARARIAQLRAAIASLRSKTVDITTHFKSTGRPNQAGNHAYGGLYATNGARYFAGGGFGDVANRHMPELAGPGSTRVWREPETQGEAYIPLANDDRRPRARSIAAETIGMLGGDPDSIEWYAKGGHHKGHKAKATKSDNLQHAIDKLTAAVETQTSALGDAVSKRNDLASTVGGNFLSDPFGSSNIWSAGGGAGGVLGTLRGDTAKAKEFQKILAALRKNGVSGQALAAIASTGDVGKAQGLLSLGAAGDKQYTSLYNQRAAAANAVGMYAGNSVYGAAISRDYHELVAVKRELQKLNALQKAHHKKAPERAKATGHAVAKGSNKAATAAKHHKRRHG